MNLIPTMISEETLRNYARYVGDDSFALQLAQEAIDNMPAYAKKILNEEEN